eukprot:PhM_4_TR7276/c0_g1_i1/m.90746
MFSSTTPAPPITSSILLQGEVVPSSKHPHIKLCLSGLARATREAYHASFGANHRRHFDREMKHLQSCDASLQEQEASYNNFEADGRDFVRLSKRITSGLEKGMTSEEHTAVQGALASVESVLKSTLDEEASFDAARRARLQDINQEMEGKLLALKEKLEAARAEVDTLSSARETMLREKYDIKKLKSKSESEVSNDQNDDDAET